VSDYEEAQSTCPADYEKDPDSTILIPFHWAKELDGDTIATSDFILPDGMTEGTNGGTGSTRTVKVSGGDCGGLYRVTNRITTTTGGLTLDKTVRVLVRER
jgi:hypothetical protein